MSLSRVFVLRVWLEPSLEGSLWRASLSNTQDGTRRYYSQPEALIASLEEELLGSITAAPPPLQPLEEQGENPS